MYVIFLLLKINLRKKILLFAHYDELFLFGTETESQAPRLVTKHEFLRRHYADCFNIFRLLYTIFIRVILGFGYGMSLY